MTPIKAHYRIAAIVPVFNHGAAVGGVVASIRALQLPVLLVDDGCDGSCAAVLTGLAAADEQVRLIRLECNSGKGAALVAGFAWALGLGYSHVLQIDADAQHDAGAIPEAIALSMRQPNAIIAGNPIFDASIPRARLYGRYLTHLLVWLHTLSFQIRDALCGFRIYPLAEAVSLSHRHSIARRMDFDIDIIVRLHWEGVPVHATPINVTYPADGISHFDLLRDNLRIARIHIRLFIGMLLRLPMLIGQRLSWGRA